MSRNFQFFFCIPETTSLNKIITLNKYIFIKICEYLKKTFLI